MVDWYRRWHGASMDPKFLMIGRKAGVAPGMVSWLFESLCEHASAAEDRGSVAGYDVETASAWTEWPQEKLQAAYDGLLAKGLITQDQRIANWDKLMKRVG
jgi:hypothetical protein